MAFYQTRGARPKNCEVGVHDADAPDKVRTRCPDCRQFHLRPGYCQAHDPINAHKYPEVWARGRETRTPAKADPDETLSDTSETDKLETDNFETDNETLSGSETLSETDKSCQGCGVMFRPKRADAAYCSPGCRLKTYRRKAGA